MNTYMQRTGIIVFMAATRETARPRDSPATDYPSLYSRSNDVWYTLWIHGIFYMKVFERHREKGFMSSLTFFVKPGRGGLMALKYCHIVEPHFTHWNGNSVYIFLFWELRGLSPNFHIHVSVSDLYIPRIGPHLSSSRNGSSIVGIYNSLTDTWMWKLGLRPRIPDIPFLGIFAPNFRHFFLCSACVFSAGKVRADWPCLFKKLADFCLWGSPWFLHIYVSRQMQTEYCYTSLIV